MWETMRMLANHPEALRLSVHCIGPTALERLKDLPSTKTYCVPDAERDKGMSGSTAHGACVEHALQMTDDGDIHIIVDSDTAILARGWDDYIRCELLDRKVGTIGTTYEDVGGFTSGGGNVQTYKGIPNVVWMALSPLHKWRDLRAMPRKGDDIEVKNADLAKTYGLPIGYHVLRDVAWQVPEYLAKRNISYVGWKQLKPTKDATVLKGLSDYHEEYHVTTDNVPFVVHHRGSMRNKYKGDRISQNFYGAVDAWLAKEREHPARWTWQPTPDNQDVLRQLQMTRDNPVPSTSANVSGWLKATIDGENAWDRYATPVPSTIDISFVPDTTCRHVRLEGSVTGVQVVLPPAPTRPHALTVRNVTLGPVTLKTSEGRAVAVVPINQCWHVIVDVDGVIHAQ